MASSSENLDDAIKTASVEKHLSDLLGICHGVNLEPDLFNTRVYTD